MHAFGMDRSITLKSKQRDPRLTLPIDSISNAQLQQKQIHHGESSVVSTQLKKKRTGRDRCRLLLSFVAEKKIGRQWHSLATQLPPRAPSNTISTYIARAASTRVRLTFFAHQFGPEGQSIVVSAGASTKNNDILSFFSSLRSETNRKRKIAMINMMKLMMTTTMMITLICVLLKTK